MRIRSPYWDEVLEVCVKHMLPQLPCPSCMAGEGDADVRFVVDLADELMIDADSMEGRKTTLRDLVPANFLNPVFIKASDYAEDAVGSEDQEDELFARDEEAEREGVRRSWILEDMEMERWYAETFFDDCFEIEDYSIVDRYEHLDDLRPTKIGVRKAVRVGPNGGSAFIGNKFPAAGKERAFFRKRHLHRRSLEAERAA